MAQDALGLAALIGNLASAAGIALLGAFTLTGGRARPPGAVPFGLFAIGWGLEIAFANLALIASSAAAATRLYLLSLTVLLPLAYFLVEFAAAQLRGWSRPWLWRALRLTTAGLAVVSSVILIARPELLFVTAREDQGQFIPDWGPLTTGLVALPHFLAFGLALLALSAAASRAPTPRVALRQSTLVVGLGLYAGFAASNNLLVYLALPDPSRETLSFVAVFALLTVIALYVGLGSLGEARRARTRDDRRRSGVIAAAILVPFACGAIEGVLVAGPLPTLSTVGLWRLAGAIVLAFGLARWWLPELPKVVRRTAVGGAGTAGAVATGAATYGGVSLVAGGAAAPLVVAIGVSMAALVPSLRLARRLFNVERAPAVEPHDESYGKRLDAYRAALEASMARGMTAPDDQFLAGLRGRFGITDAEDQVLRYYARSSVLVPSEGGVRSAYERLRLLGEGGGGRTWLARDRVRDRLVVLKEPLPHWQRDAKLRAMVLREATLAAKVRHANVVAIEEVTEDNGLPVFIMEYLEGGSLADRLRARRTLPEDEAVAVLEDVLAGLSAIHARSVLHRDLKPSNILLTDDGRAKIADFGIAVEVGGDRTAVEGESDQSGTASYMAPEVASGEGRPSVASDVYSCGAVLYELLHGRPPSAVGPERRVSKHLANVLARALATDPKERFASARAFREALARGAT